MPDQPESVESSARPPSEAADETRIIPHGASAGSEQTHRDEPTNPGSEPGEPPLVAAVAAPAKIEPGQILGHTYEIEALLARGGMGEVYRARHIEMGSLHAIKVILPDLANDARMVGMFKEEAKKLRRMRDDAVVAYEGLFRDELGRRYLVMEFVDGISLAKLIKQRPLSVEEVRRLRDRCAGGLAAAHDKGIYHRDISPDNIILVEGKCELAKIIDFGIAKSTDAGDRTVVGDAFGGKLSWASPEQLGLFGGHVDGRSDIYSLGLVLAAAAQGRQLDMGASHISVIEKRQSVPDLSGLPLELRAEIAPMLQPDPKDRPQSMRDLGMLAELGAMPRPSAAAPSAPSAAPATPADDPFDIMPVPTAEKPKPPPEPAKPPPARRSPALAIAAAAASFVVVVAVGAGYVLLVKEKPPAEVASVTQRPSTPPPAPVPPPAVTPTPSPPVTTAAGPPPVTPNPPPVTTAAVTPPPAATPSVTPPTPAAPSVTPPPSKPPAPPVAAVPTPSATPSPPPTAQIPPPESPAPPVPTPAVVPPPSPPVQTAALEPQLRTQTTAEIQRLIGQFQCADVSATVGDDLRVDISGFVGQQADLDRLHGTLRGMENVKLGGDSVAVYSFPFCAFVKLLRQQAGAAGNPPTAPRLDFNKPSKVYHNTEKLTLKATAGRQRDGYLYVDYIDNSGTVVHMFPTPMRKNNFVKAGQQVSIGTTDPNAKDDERVYEISEPFGPNLIIAISSPKPLFDRQQDEAEPADQYLRTLQAKLSGLAATPAGKDVSSAYSLIDTVQ